MSDFWDPDIDAMNLSEIEKDGLQVYRNYTKAFEEHGRKLFAAEVNSRTFDVNSLASVVTLIAHEDARFVPVVACSFIDELLLKMFRANLPHEVPGSTSNLYSQNGPLGGLASRIQMAYLFDWLSPDNLHDADRLRRARNKIAHRWQLNDALSDLSHSILKDISDVENILADGTRLKPTDVEKLNDEERFRFRTIWILGRTFYESHLYPIAKLKRLSPVETLYGAHHPNLLGDVAGVCKARCAQILSAAVRRVGA